MDRSRLVVAEIIRPRGNRGEVLARSLTDIPGRLEGLKAGHVRLADGVDRAVRLDNAWPHKDGWVLKFEGVDSIEAAEAFRGSDLWLEPSLRADLSEGEFFESDLIGCTVTDRESGRAYGIVEGFQRYGGVPLMELTVAEREVLIPFVASECRISLDARLIEVTLPDGLLDLN